VARADKAQGFAGERDEEPGLPATARMSATERCGLLG